MFSFHFHNVHAHNTKHLSTYTTATPEQYTELNGRMKVKVTNLEDRKLNCYINTISLKFYQQK